jgi:predicted transcriptional regulator
MPLTADSVLDALAGQMTAQKLAERLGHSKPTEVVPVLNSLADEGQVVRRVDTEGNPVARWRRT